MQHRAPTQHDRTTSSCPPLSCPLADASPTLDLLLSAQILAWALNFGACFGGNGTLIGASANIVTATLAERAGEHISFMQWLKGGVPVTIVSCGC